MKLHLKVIVGGLAACMWPGAAHAQASAASSGATLEAIVKEVRLLRQTLERQSAGSARAQLMVARLTLYDQRAARTRQAVDRLEADVASAERERDQLQVAVRENTRALEQVTDPDRRQQLELESRMLRTRFADVERQRSTSGARLTRAKQTLDMETARYEELDRSLNDLDRQLQGGQ